MSLELKEFLHSHGIATSRTSPYNPQGNGQIERYNGTLWKAISLSLQEHGLETKEWEKCLPDALHSIRSLLCTATNATPHERLFSFHRKTSNGCTLPVWLVNPGTVLLKRHVRASKYEPLVEEVDLIEANPNYAHVQLKNGVEKTVSLKDLAPAGDVPTLKAKTPVLCIKRSEMDPTPCPVRQECPIQDSAVEKDDQSNDSDRYVTRSGRTVKSVDRLMY